MTTRTISAVYKHTSFRDLFDCLAPSLFDASTHNQWDAFVMSIEYKDGHRIFIDTPADYEAAPRRNIRAIIAGHEYDVHIYGRVHRERREDGVTVYGFLEPWHR